MIPSQGSVCYIVMKVAVMYKMRLLAGQNIQR